MLVMETKPETKSHLGLPAAPLPAADLRVERTDIAFCDSTQDRVRIQVTVHNTGESPSEPTTMTLESAPFGAFVTWRPLSQLMVPALAPGESIELSTEVPRPRPVPLGDFDRVPPRKLLTALSSPDQPLQPAQPNVGLQAFFQRLWRRRPAPAEGRVAGADTSLSWDIWDLVGRGQPHWAGNINVFVNHRPVERHLAKALRIYPGRVNLAMFVVGSPGNRDAFTFELVGLDPSWKAVLHDVTNDTSLTAGPSTARIEEAQWVESNGGLLIVLATQPPSDCSQGCVEVHVTRRSDEQVGIVEFDLDPAAKGPGCYTL